MSVENGAELQLQLQRVDSFLEGGTDELPPREAIVTWVDWKAEEACGAYHNVIYYGIGFEDGADYRFGKWLVENLGWQYGTGDAKRTCVLIFLAAEAQVDVGYPESMVIGNKYAELLEILKYGQLKEH